MLSSNLSVVHTVVVGEIVVYGRSHSKRKKKGGEGIRLCELGCNRTIFRDRDSDT